MLGSEGRIAFVIGEGERLHVRGERAGVRFHLEGSRYDYVYRTPQGEQCLVAAVENVKFIPRAVAGHARRAGAWQRDHSEKVSFAFSGEAFRSQCRFLPHRAARTIPEAMTMRWRAHRRIFPPGTRACRKAVAGQEEAHRLASYLLWANGVPVGGALTRPAIYMSKNHMINIWSWDNAFSALGVAGVDASLAFDQFAVIFDHQDASGLLPDYINDRDVLFAFTKPPVHGWAVSLIEAMQPGFLTSERKAYLNAAIGKQVDYWLTFARAGSSTLPSYFHGNDSGWDNATFFAEGGPVVSPDLPTFLILACDDACGPARRTILRMLRNGGRRREDLQAMLIEKLWTGETFCARLVGDPDACAARREPHPVHAAAARRASAARNGEKLVARLVGGGFITEWGPATESPKSPFYEDDGYWRGPIWAPTTLLLWDGLRRQGEMELARTIAEKFCSLASKNGMAENFDARSGRGLRDRAFAWTSATYILLAASLSQNHP